MLEVIKKIYRIEDEELVEYGNLTIQCDELEEEVEAEIIFTVNGEITIEDGCSSDVKNVKVAIDSITVKIDEKTIDIKNKFNIEELEEEIREYINVTSYENLEFEGDMAIFLRSYLINSNICEE